MNKRKIFMIITIISIIVLPLLYFNWATLTTGIGVTYMALLTILILILAAGPLYLTIEFVLTKLKLRYGHSLTATTKMGKMLPQKVLDKNALFRVNDNRGTDSAQIAEGELPMTKLFTATASRRDDAISWVLQAFTTSDMYATRTHRIGQEEHEIPLEKVWFVFQDGHNGYSYEMPGTMFNNLQEVYDELWRKWKAGISKTDESAEFGKTILSGIAEGIGQEKGKQAAQKKEEKEGNNE